VLQGMAKLVEQSLNLPTGDKKQNTGAHTGLIGCHQTTKPVAKHLEQRLSPPRGGHRHRWHRQKPFRHRQAHNQNKRCEEPSSSGSSSSMRTDGNEQQ
jgi:hypothetical protein